MATVTKVGALLPMNGQVRPKTSGKTAVAKTCRFLVQNGHPKFKPGKKPLDISQPETPECFSLDYSSSTSGQNSLEPNLIAIHDDGVSGHSNLTPTYEIGIAPWEPQTELLLKSVDERGLNTLESLLASGASVNSHGGSFQETPLHKAAQNCWTEGVQFLVSHGASVLSKNQFSQTPLHYAAAAKSPDCVRLLLEAKCQAAIDHRDMRGHTPLHDAAAVGCTECVSRLCKAGALVGIKDVNDETPLHKAAKARSIPTMMVLLNRGADLSAKDHSGESVLSYILRHFPGGMESLLDMCLSTNSEKLSTKKLEVLFNFSPLIGNPEKNQIKTLKAIVDMGHPKILLHPVCEAYLLLTWHNVKKQFFVEVMFYFIYSFLVTLLTLDKFVWDHEDDPFLSLPANAYTAVEIIVILQATFLLLKQLFTMTQGIRTWISSIWHVMNGVIPMLVLLVILGDYQLWQHHVATITLLLLWVQCMLNIGRFPGCGIYVAMFTRVAKVFLKIFLIFFCLLVAFSMSFYIGINAGHTSVNKTEGMEGSTGVLIDVIFANPILTFVKILTMMIGELDFDSEFVKQLGYLPGTSHVIFLAFAILMAIILSNLLVALAVNDVQGLRNSANLERLIKQMELVFQMQKTFGSLGKLVSYLKLYRLCSYLKLFKLDIDGRLSIQPFHPQKCNKFMLKTHGVIKEIKIRQSFLTNIVECLRLRETQYVMDKKSSVRKRPSRISLRTDYSSTEYLKDNLKQLEINISETLSERLEDIMTMCSDLSSRLKLLEDKIEELAKGKS